MLLALLQPAPETFDLFDDIMLLSEGESQGQPLLLSCYGVKQRLGYMLPTDTDICAALWLHDSVAGYN